METVQAQIHTQNDVVIARQLVRRGAQQAGLSLVDQTKIVTAASELARNTLVYGLGGTMTMEVLEGGARSGVRLTFVDQGPGIPNIELALTDGWTSGNGLGMGLSGAKRLVNEFEIESRVGRGDTRLDRAVEMKCRCCTAFLCKDGTRSARAAPSATARRDSQHLAAELNLDETSSAQVGVVVTELATNVLRHAGEGEILLQGIAGSEGAAIEIVAIDRGRGMRDIESACGMDIQLCGNAGYGTWRGEASVQ